MKKFGFELEAFVVQAPVEGAALRDGEIGPTHVVVPNGLPHDECGYLAEARGEPHKDPFQAAASMVGEFRRMGRLAEKSGVRLEVLPATRKLPPAFLQECLRKFGKGVSPGQGSMYGKAISPTDRWSRAGLHVHFSDEEVSASVYHDKQPETSRTLITSHLQLDMPWWIRGLDMAFAQEILEARRVPGRYEMKLWGFEYRSLPASVDVWRVAEVLEGLGRR